MNISMTQEQMIADFIDKAIASIRVGSIENRQAAKEARDAWTLYLRSLDSPKRQGAELEFARHVVARLTALEDGNA